MGDLEHHDTRCHVTYRVWEFEDGRRVRKAEEVHTVRYFFPLELAFYLEQSGFTLLRVGVFPDFSHDPDDKTWNVLVVARAI